MGACLGGPKPDDAKSLDNAKPKSKKKGNPDYPFVPPDNIVKDMWTVFNKKKVLGKGASCEVAHVQHKGTQQEYAMKIMLQDDKWNPILFKQEVHILKALTHKNIMRYGDCFMDRTNFYVGLELCGGGELFDKIKDMKRFSERVAAEYIKTIISAIEHCHSKNIVHRDLKPENIVFRTAAQKELVIIDFGDAKEIEDDKIYEDFVGTAYYLAPECVRDRKGWELKKSDMWTIGVITYVCLTGRPPFYGKNNKAILRKILQGNVNFPKKPKLSKTAMDFINKLLQKEPKKRLSATEALQHPWFNQASDNELGKGVQHMLADYSQASKLKKVLVRMLAREMSSEDEDLFRNQFATIDQDKSGYIDKKELMKFITSTGVAEDTAEKQAQQMVDAVDADGDGQINYEEFKDARLSSKLTDDDLIQKEFKKIDTDGNGFITHDELQQLFNWTIAEDMIKKMINEIDENNDGQISLEEFTAAMKKGSFKKNLVVDKRREAQELKKLAHELDKYEEYRQQDDGRTSAGGGKSVGM